MTNGEAEKAVGTRIRRSWLLMLAIALPVVFAACGDDSDDESSDDGTEEVEGTDEAEGGRETEGELVELAGGEIGSPGVAVDGDGLVHAVWNDSGAVVARSLGSSGEWSEPEVLSGDAEATFLSVEVGPDGRACVFYKSEGVPVVQCRDDRTWSSSREYVGDIPTLGGVDPALDADGEPIAIGMGASCCVTFDGVPLSPDNPSDTSGGPALAVDSDGRLHAVYLQQRGPEGTDLGMVHRISEDGGATWSDPEVIDAESISLTNQLVADAEGGVHLLDHIDTYRQWTAEDGWSDPVSSGGEFYGGWLAVDDEGRALVAYAEADGVYVARQRESGTFGAPRRIAGTAGNEYGEVAVAVDADGSAHLLVVTTGDDPTLSYLALTEGRGALRGQSSRRE
jgi:hypothetical protein